MFNYFTNHDVRIMKSTKKLLKRRVRKERRKKQISNYIYSFYSFYKVFIPAKESLQLIVFKFIEILLFRNKILRNSADLSVLCGSAYRLNQ